MSRDDWDEKADLVLQRLRASGAESGDVRILDSTTQVIRGEDRRIAGVEDLQDNGLGVRVLYRGAWGFAASSVMTAGEVQRVTNLAIDIAKGSTRLTREPVQLCEEPVHRDRAVTRVRVDPFDVPLESKTRLLLDVMESLHRQPGIARSAARL